LMAMAPSESQLTQRHLGRMLLVLCIGLIGLVILALALLPYIVSLERVKQALVSQVEAALQRRVHIGAVRLHILLGLGAHLEDLRIENPSGWPQPQLLKIGTLAVQVAFLPLLQGTIELTKMRVHGGEILIERDPNRQLNRADLAESTPGGAHVPASPAPKGIPGGGEPMGNASPGQLTAL
jgi:uncharacterized protein involved in outer membrane biogenesis